MVIRAWRDEGKQGRGRRFARGLRRTILLKSASNRDGGQAMVLVLALLAILALVPVVIAHDVINEFPLLSREVQTQQAEAAAEAGVQHYRNLLDNVPNYWSYSATSLPSPVDLALETTNGTVNGPPVWNPVTSTSTESYHYVPNTTCILTNGCINSPYNGDVVLTVTGRAGGNGHYSYQSLTATFQLSGILNDAYYSEYEILDPNYPSAYPTDSSGQYLETSIYPAGSYSNMESPIPSLTNSLFMDLCGYHSFEPNAYIDSMNSIVDPDSGLKYNNSHPYYGPFFGSEPIINQNGQTPNSEQDFVLPAGASGNPSSGSLTFGPTNANPNANSPCNQPFNFKDGETFNGTVYTNDQIYTSGNPVFNGTPQIDTGAKNNLTYYYAWNWPGSKSKTVGCPTCQTVYYPAGWIDTGGSDPSGLSYANEGPANQILPQFDASVRAYADGQFGNGCLFTGPTMIEFVKPAGAGNSTMNVWSPLTVSNSAIVNGTTYSSTSACGSYSPSHPWQTGIALPSDGVIYVQSVPSLSTDPNCWPATTGAGTCATVPPGTSLAAADTTVVNGTPPVPNKCLDPYTPNWQSNWAASAGSGNVQCPASTIGEGDVVIEGELHGQVTLATDANVLVSRDVTYTCADSTMSGGVADQTLPSSCATSGSQLPDILGIAVDNDVVLSHPTNDTSSNGNGPSPGWVSGTPGSCGSQDGTTLTAAISSAATAATLNSYIAPTCDSQDPVLDAAIVALGGALGVENYDQQDAFEVTGHGGGYTNGGGFHINGTDISFFRGPFGTFSGSTNDTGYDKELNYDSRLGYATPPYYLAAVSTVWNLTSVDVCGSTNAAAAKGCTALH